MRGIIGELKAVGGGVTVVDMEAGLELFGRGTPSASDLLLTVIEPSLWSIHTARRIVELARELGIPRVAVVANKIREAADAEWIREAMRPQGVEVIAVVPYDAEVSRADRRMRSLLDIAPDSAAAAAIAGLVDAIGKAVDMPAPVGAAGGGPTRDDGCPWVVDR